jgi:4-amino-4-deoxy-L-arabinose transferase-like glycosyltransferase
MTELTGGSIRRASVAGPGVVIGIAAAFMIVRLAGLTVSEVELFVDEAQYWSWSNDLALGYSSKPPLVAWIIKLAEAVCGSGEACIRAPSPILYFGTATVTYVIARDLYGRLTAFWAALLLMFGPALVFSSRIISTDVPLLFFWALALLAFLRLREQANWRWTAVLGVSLGLGLLAKYAMIYFVLGMLLAAVLDARSRAALRSPKIWFALAIAAAMIAPNLIWVLQHDAVTFKNVAGAVQDAGAPGWSPLPVLEFLATQFAIFGPVVFAVLLVAMARIGAPEPVPADRLLLAFAIPPLAIITAVALFSRAYGNWAATAVVSGTILAAALLVRRRAWGWLGFSLALGLFVQAILLYGDARASRFAIPFAQPGRSDVYQRSLGFRVLADEVARFASQVNAKTIAAEERRTIAALLYYLRDAPQPVVAWPSPAAPHLDMSRPLTEAAQQPVLLVTECPFPRRLAAHYAEVEKIGEIKTPTGPTSLRYFAVFRLGSPRGAPTMLAKCQRERP